MDSVIHCKKMSQLELSPQLSLSMTHHHQRGKGDSAYSSFSGNSTAPDQPPYSVGPLLPDHLQYLKSVCDSSVFLEPCCSSPHILHSDPASIRTSAQILEAYPTSICSLTHVQHPEPTSVILQPDHTTQWPHARFVPGTNDILKTNIRIDSQHQAQTPPHPPQIPARLDSFIAIKNLENLRLQQDAEPKQIMRPTHSTFYDHTALSQSMSSSSRQEHRRLSAGWNGSGGGDQHIQKKKRSHSAHDCPSLESSPEPCCAAPTDPLKSDSSVQHKGHFYFVTGVCQSAEAAVRTGSMVAVSDDNDELREKGDDLRLSATPHSPHKVFHSMVKDVGAHRSHPQPTFDVRGRHTEANPIFYCGPPWEGSRTSERISKEATPLLYQLTVSKAAMQQQPWHPREEGCGGGGGRGGAGTRWDVDASGAGSSSNSSVIHPLDDSFHRSYKDKLKVAQSKVLSRTSFQRRDLQLTRPPSLTTSERAELDGIVKGVDSEALKFNVAHPRLAPEQQKKKTMCFSEPEKLHKLGSTPSHAPSHSVPGGNGLVVQRRLMFESKGRALSASSAIHTNLKHLQHQALLDYIVRKTGQRGGDETQQQSPQLALALPPTQTQSPSQSRQRHSLGEKPFDWLPVQQEDSSSSRKKNQLLQLQRPHSAGRILDASSCSIRYAQFFPTKSSHRRWGQGQGGRGRGGIQVRSVSVESLLETPELLQRKQRQQTPSFLRDRSTSTPQTLDDLQVCDGDKKLLAGQQGSSNSSSVLKKISSTTSPMTAEGQTPTSRVSQKGWFLSRSSEQLEQLWRNRRRNLDTEIPKEPLNHCHTTKGWNADLLGEPWSSPAFSCIGTSARTWTQPGPPRPPKDMPSSNQLSPPAREEATSHSSSDTQAMPLRDDIHFALPLGTLENKALQHEDPQEVSLSCGITTDPSLWLLHPEESKQEEQEKMEEKGELKRKAEEVVPPPTDSLLDQEERESVASSCNDQYQEEVMKDVKEMREEQFIAEKTKSTKQETKEEQNSSKQAQWAELVEAVVDSDQSLARVFYPLANRKTAQMLMEQLLCEDTLLMEKHYRRRKKEQNQEEEELFYSPTSSSTEDSELSAAPAVAHSSCPEVQSNTHIDQQKRHLVAMIKGRLHWLKEKQAPLQEEQEENAARRRHLEAIVQECCSPLELERYLLFVGDLERVVSLLLCLSARLARVENALATVDQHTDAEEKHCLDSRYRLLCKQRQDASELKENLQRREKMVLTFLRQQLNQQQLLLYQHFLQTTAYLLIRNKELEEQQRLAQEQLEALGAGP